MSVCDPSQNAAVPAYLTPLAQAGIAVTPAMQTWAATFANDLTIPINSVRTAWFSGRPIAAWINCHTYTQQGTQQIPGDYHGASLYLINNPAYYPPGGAAMARNRIDWPLVAGTGLALSCVVGAFFLALRHAGRAAAATPRR